MEVPLDCVLKPPTLLRFFTPLAVSIHHFFLVQKRIQFHCEIIWDEGIDQVINWKKVRIYSRLLNIGQGEISRPLAGVYVGARRVRLLINHPPWGCTLLLPFLASCRFSWTLVVDLQCGFDRYSYSWDQFIERGNFFDVEIFCGFLVCTKMADVFTVSAGVQPTEVLGFLPSVNLKLDFFQALFWFKTDLLYWIFRFLQVWFQKTIWTLVCYWMWDCFVFWSIDSLIDTLTDPSSDGLIDWLIDCPIVGRSIDWLVGLIDCLICIVLARCLLPFSWLSCPFYSSLLS